MRHLAALSVFALLFLLCFEAYPFEGPLRTRNQFPLFITVSPVSLEKASTGDSLSLGLSHSSVFMVKSSPDWSVNLDMEVTEIMIGYRKKILDSLELGIDIPFLSLNSGFLDNVLDGYHRAFGFPDYGRSSRPANEFLYEVRKRGVPIIKSGGGTIGIGDVRLAAKKVILDGDPVLSLRADVELPTGDASRGLGNGSVDGGIALLTDKGLSERVMLYGNIGVVFPGDLKGRETVGLKEFFQGGVGIEAKLRENLALLGQVSLQGSPFPETGIPSLDRTAVLLSLGGRYLSGRNSFEFSFTEDPNTAGAPDFTLAFSFKRRF